MAIANLGNLALEDPGELGFHHNGPNGKSNLTTQEKLSPNSKYTLDFYQDVPIEEFVYYARLQRADEERAAREGWSGRFSADGGSRSSPSHSSDGLHDNEKAGASKVEGQVSNYHGMTNREKQYEGLSSLEIEKLDARNAMRMAKWQFAFALIVTDILGPFNAPYAVSQLGLVPGNLIYTFMGVAAWICSTILWRLFLALDSARYPVKTFGDIGERIFGTWARYVIVVLQTIQLVINVGLICLSSGQSLSQMENTSLCFSVSVLVWALLGMVVAQVRTLKNFGYISVAAVIMNVAVILISMPAIATKGPNYEAAASTYGYMPPFAPPSESVLAFGGLPLETAVNGAMNVVFAYGGAMIFFEVFAEMRRPWDFWKSLMIAEIFLVGLYLLYANIIYCYSGKYTMPVSFQGIGSYGLQTACNILSIISGMIAAALYGNIGLKVLYIEIVERWCKGPALMSKKGTMLWIPISITYWGLAFVIASAIPQVGTVSGLVAAIAILQFSYTFPFGLGLAWLVQRDAMAGEPEFDPVTKQIHRQDTWLSRSRWYRGFLTGTIDMNPFTIPATADPEIEQAQRRQFKVPALPVKIFLLGCFLASVATAALGMYGSGLSIANTFAMGGASGTSFGCKSPA